MRSEKNRLALRGASTNAARAIESVSAAEFAHVSIDEKSAWAMAALIHCDVCRLVIAFNECERDGIARLLCMADISSKLYEARNWYTNTGTALLRVIAERKSCGVADVNQRMGQLQKMHDLHRINKYADYRNKLGYHYDPQALQYLQRFADEDAGEFFAILRSFVRFSGGWAQLTKSLVQDRKLA